MGSIKKLISVLLSVVSVICIAFAFVGCGNSETEDVKGRITKLKYANSEMGWLDEDDLKSVACRQYECYEMQENPYAGLYKQKTQLSAKEEKDFKQAYCDYYNYNNTTNFIEPIEPSDIQITNYYGTYEGNIVAEVVRFSEESMIAEDKIRIGGVDFILDYHRDIYVFHYAEDWPTDLVTGTLYSISKAYEKGWLDENDLKSIACCCYDLSGKEENPYSGMYVKPEEKLSKEKKTELKKAYLRQIDKVQIGDLDSAYIHRYYGTYNGHIVVRMSSDSCKFGAVPVDELAGITNVNWSSIYVYS